MIMYEIFEHTADLGLRLEAESVDELFAEAARGLVAALCENPEAIRPSQTLTFDVPGDRLDELLHDWLNEVLYTITAQRVLLTEFEVAIDPRGLRAVVRGEPIDRARHQLDMEVKAITYHGLVVDQRDGRWRAEVIVDI